MRLHPLLGSVIVLLLSSSLARPRALSIEQLRANVPTIAIVALPDTTHARFMTEKRGEVVEAMSTFLKSKA